MEKKMRGEVKDYQRNDVVCCPQCFTEVEIREDREWRFRDWHRDFPRWCYQMNLDVLEYRRASNGDLMPVALLELSRFDGDRIPGPAYFSAWLDRIHERDDNAAALKKFAEMLCCDAYLVLFQADLRWFMVYNLSTGKGWENMTPAAYMAWTRGMAAVKRFDPAYVPPHFY